jgi:bifunctional non-homologous end joining protein LigD
VRGGAAVLKLWRVGRDLDAYRRKRHFDRTPEPAPQELKAEGRAAGPMFMVHKHDASRLHYDLRLEMGGALASWAVPRGPSLDPAQKRLAVQTEDHPLAYAQFEGRIPQGEYGAGDTLIWDRGTYETDPPGEGERQRREGHLRLILRGQKLQGLWHLVRTRPAGGKSQWLLFKGRDRFARAGGDDDDLLRERPESVASGRRATRGPLSARAAAKPARPPVDLLLATWPPMRAILARAGDVGGKPFLYEVKYDGFRALAGVSAGRIALQSRSGLDLAARFPAVAKALVGLEVREAVLDGEIAAFDRDGRSRFEGLSDPRAHPQYVAFDLLWLDGEDLRARPLEERRDLLESAAWDPAGEVRLAERLEGPLERALGEAKRRKLEGIMAKRPGSPYRPGPSRDWLKVKLRATQDVAIVGYLPMTGAGRQVGALLAAVYGNGALRFAGKVGTGFDARARRELAAALDAHRVEGPPAAGAPRLRGARWSEPRLVGQVQFAEWTRDGMLRAPSFQGLRADKRPEECAREEAPAK